MRQLWRFLALGVGVYLLILLATFPATRAVHFLEQQNTGLTLQSVSGTVFSGQAGRVLHSGQELGPVSWSFRPVALLLGRVEYRVTFDGPLFRGSGYLGTGFGAEFNAHDVVGELQPDPLVNRYLPVPMETAGSISLTLDTLKVSDGFPADLSGIVQWTEAAILEPVQLSFGKVEVNLGGSGDAVTAGISSAGGATAVSGELTLLAAGEYRLQLLLKPGPETDPGFTDMLESYGKPQADGAFLITDSGEW
ncbi:MAG: type II secretion system protein N [Thiohalobacterales bacterium]